MKHAPAQVQKLPGIKKVHGKNGFELDDAHVIVLADSTVDLKTMQGNQSGKGSVSASKA